LGNTTQGWLLHHAGRGARPTRRGRHDLDRELPRVGKASIGDTHLRRSRANVVESWGEADVPGRAPAGGARGRYRDIRRAAREVEGERIQVRIGGVKRLKLLG